ncbi:unnamed protein product [Gulo gulo]|uniref:Uncharacterized protein n=1 Tax=Gulo gulo TaxID=48420 RepID=A0A9X9LU31_GULGU|nr:unnamed protein product [Gulo gulo]
MTRFRPSFRWMVRRASSPAGVFCSRSRMPLLEGLLSSAGEA